MANKTRYDDLYTGTIAYATLLSCIILVITILGVRALCCAWLEGEEDRKTASASYIVADEKISEQRSRLGGYRKEITKVKGEAEPVGAERLAIPIDNAKELLFEELSKDSSST